MVLVVVLLQLVEVVALGLASIDVVQCVVAGIIGCVAQVEEGPEDGRNEWVVEAHHPPYCEVAQGDYDQEEGRWQDEAVAEWKGSYGSLGSIWWMPCDMKWM